MLLTECFCSGKSSSQIHPPHSPPNMMPAAVKSDFLQNIIMEMKRSSHEMFPQFTACGVEQPQRHSSAAQRGHDVDNSTSVSGYAMNSFHFDYGVLLRT